MEIDMQEKNEDEQWKDIPNYAGYYKVSNLGNIKSVKRSYVNSIGIKMTLKERILKPNKIKGGYYQVKFEVKGLGTKNFLVHRLVAQAFISNPYNKPEVNHRWGDKSDNRADSLEWCTRLENVKHAFATGLKVKGTGYGNAKLTEWEVLQVCYMVDYTNFSVNDIADLYRVDRRTISSIKTGASWNWLTRRL